MATIRFALGRRENLLAAQRLIRSTVVVGLLLVFALAACAPAPPPIEKAIVGRWVNTAGGEIDFFSDGTGFIPAGQDEIAAIPATTFTYYFKDQTHIGIVLEGQSAIVMEIKIEGDTMTWGTIGETEFVYTRVK